MSNKITRSRNGCQKCKKLKIKCDEQKPSCGYCLKKNIPCDYSKKLVWGGRPFKDNRVLKSMKFENTSFIEGICAIDLKSQTKSSRKSRNESKKSDDLGSGTLVVSREHADSSENFPTPTRNETMDYSHLESVPLDQSVSMYEGPNEYIEIINDENCSKKSSSLSPSLSILSPRNLESSFFESFQIPSPSTISSTQDIIKNNGAMPQFNLFNLRMPSFLPELLLNSPEMAESFDFFLNETAHMLVPAPKSVYTRNPFFNLLPKMAMDNTALLNMLLVFGANHKNKILSYNGCTTSSSALVASDLLTNTFSNLLNQLSNDSCQNSDSTLATVLLLAGFDIFFSDKRQKWRTHVYGARKIMQQRFSGGSEAILLSECDSFLDDKHFLLKWFAYIDIISSLSSTNFVTNLRKLESVKYEVADKNKPLEENRKTLRDIEYFTGMEVACLSMLGEVSSLINEKETNPGIEVPQSFILQALELDHKIVTYLRKSEEARDIIYEKYYKTKTDAYTKQQYDAYRTLRATNQIFALTGVLQLKRRVLGISPSSPIVKDILVNISDLVRRWIEFGSSAETCIIFCIFCVGCELTDPDLEPCRALFQEHFLALVRKGVSSAEKGREIMEDCWSQDKQWWDILKERNLDITFAL